MRCISSKGTQKERACILESGIRSRWPQLYLYGWQSRFADYNGRGILLRNYDHDREVRLTWSAVDKRLDRLVENDQYLTALEMEEYRKLEQEYGAPLPMPTAAHVFPPTPPERYDTGNEHVDNMLNTAADVYARSELAAPQRFTVMETDDGYAVWDDIQDGIHVEPDGVSEEFTSEWEAETYRQQLIEKFRNGKQKTGSMLNRASRICSRTFHSQMWNPKKYRNRLTQRQILWYWKCRNTPANFPESLAMHRMNGLWSQ